MADLNFITSHDGFTLWIYFSYSEKRNQTNGENNRDGHSANFSNNLGVEGRTENQLILGLREQKWRMAWTILAISRGPMMFVAGDEWGRTQNGNNNAYCHDNELNWLNWQESETYSERIEFVRGLLSLRAKLSKSCWLSSSLTIRWFNSQGDEADWSPHIRSFVWKIENSEEGIVGGFSAVVMMHHCLLTRKKHLLAVELSHYLGISPQISEETLRNGSIQYFIGTATQL